MRHIDRLPAPDILVQKHIEWQQKYDEKLAENPSARPDSPRYAHKQIKDRLFEMSFGKCFYCETKLTGANKEVDHFVEVAIDHSKAYEWENLYLACSNCNDKVNHNAIPVTDALDPCRDSDTEIQRNISFEAEQIYPIPESPKGLNTIKKFRLNTELLDMKRSKWLNKLLKKVTEIQRSMNNDGRRSVSENERIQLMRFMQPDQPYSLMCKIYIEKNFSYLLG